MNNILWFQKIEQFAKFGEKQWKMQQNIAKYDRNLDGFLPNNHEH